MYKSLLKTDIFYYDISIDNIMLTENKENDFLIDFDLVIRISDNYIFGVLSKIEIKIFMAIDTLLDESYSFIHDLESFF